MLTNYIKTAYRHFTRHKSSFLINISGLSIGLACSILILLWVLDEIEVNRFHDDIDRIYQVMEHQMYADGNIFTTSATPGLLAPALVEEVPEIEYAATYSWNIQYLFTNGDNSLKESGIYARPDILNILTFEVLAGNREHWLTEPNTVVISDELSKKLFGIEDALDQSVLIDGTRLYKIIGVYKPFQNNSTLRFDFILPFREFESQNTWVNSWANNGPRTLAKLRTDADPAQVNEKIINFVKERNEGSVVDLFLYPYADVYLYGRFENGRVVGGRIEYVRLFSVIAVFVLLIACVNFMNLSTARSTLRAREVGIRKSIGAGKGSLIGRYIGESLVISFCALIVSLILVEICLPTFNNLTEKQITLIMLNPGMILTLAGIGLITGLVAGSYPAFYLSAFEPVKTLKGVIRSSNRERLVRKGLVVFQFSLSMVLIVSTLLIYYQVQYLQTKNLGYKKENLIYFPIQGALHGHWDSFRREVSAIPGVTDISRANHHFLGRSSNTSGVRWPGKDPDVHVLFESMRVDYDLIETIGFEVQQGRAFSREFGADSARVVVNETAVKIMGIEDPVGQLITIWGQEVEIAGVVKDFNYDHLRSSIEPLFMILDIHNNWMHSGYIRLQTHDIKSTLEQIQAVHESVNPAYPLDYSFVDERYAALYRSETRIGSLSKYFATFAVFISALGLFGLSSFTAEQRKKEMSIRKVLGATATGLVALHSKEFIKLVLIAVVISAPVAYYIMNEWLQDFAYRIDIRWWIFAASGGLALLIALITVSFQAIRAARANPVEALRYE
jgi:putative ABC transport system permease protein